MIKWNTTQEDNDLICKIGKRAKQLLNADIIDTMMDIAAVHVNDTPLRLNDLLTADDSNFAHDVNGIAGHLNRQTGLLMNCFLPRFSGEKAS